MLEIEKNLKKFVDHEKSNVIIDTSLILDEKKIDHVIDFIKENNSNFSFFISHTLNKIIQFEDLQSLIVVSRIFRIKLFKVNYIKYKIEEVKELLNPFNVSLDNPNDFIYYEKYNGFYKNLGTIYRNEVIKKIIFEEWIFLQEYSWIVSRIKKIFNIFKKCGAIVIEFNNVAFKLFKKIFDILKSQYDKQVKKEFDKSVLEFITNTERLRFLGKWIGRNWPDFLLINPELNLVRVGLRRLFHFILIDP